MRVGRRVCGRVDGLVRGVAVRYMGGLAVCDKPQGRGRLIHPGALLAPGRIEQAVETHT